MNDRHPAPASFDPGVFVDDLIAAGCQLWLSRPIGHDGPPPRWFVHPDRDGRPTLAECEVVARWKPILDACPDYADRVTAHLMNGPAKDGPQLEGETNG